MTRVEAEIMIFIPLLRGVASFCFKMCRGVYYIQVEKR